MKEESTKTCKLAMQFIAINENPEYLNCHRRKNFLKNLFYQVLEQNLSYAADFMTNVLHWI